MAGDAPWLWDKFTLRLELRSLRANQWLVRPRSFPPFRYSKRTQWPAPPLPWQSVSDETDTAAVLVTHRPRRTVRRLSIPATNRLTKWYGIPYPCNLLLKPCTDMTTVYDEGSNGRDAGLLLRITPSAATAISLKREYRRSLQGFGSHQVMSTSNFSPKCRRIANVRSAIRPLLLPLYRMLHLNSFRRW